VRGAVEPAHLFGCVVVVVVGCGESSEGLDAVGGVGDMCVCVCWQPRDLGGCDCDMCNLRELLRRYGVDDVMGWDGSKQI
jgi:hypothetical protein